jgi:hypothetical protein
MAEQLTRSRRGRLSERVSAASYGTVLVLVSLVAIDVDAVDSGLGWELVTGVGVATWVAHLYAEVVGEHLRYDAALDRGEIAAAAVDGIPIIVAAVLPATMLLLGRLDILDSRVALWVAVVVAIAQLVALGAFVGHATAPSGGAGWAYAAVTGAIGVAVVVLKVALGH